MIAENKVRRAYLGEHDTVDVVEAALATYVSFADNSGDFTEDPKSQLFLSGLLKDFLVGLQAEARRCADDEGGGGSEQRAMAIANESGDLFEMVNEEVEQNDKPDS